MDRGRLGIRYPVKRGDVVTVASSGDYAKPRPAVVVETGALPPEHASVIVCQMTSDSVDAVDFRVTVEPSEKNGLRTRSQIMADKPVTIRRERVGARIGALDEKDFARLNVNSPGTPSQDLRKPSRSFRRYTGATITRV